MSDPKQRLVITPRQIQLLELLRDGYIAKEVAVRLGISVSTIRVTLVDIHERLGALNTTHAVIIAIRKGYIGLE